jgi:hypothetical protein
MGWDKAQNMDSGLEEEVPYDSDLEEELPCDMVQGPPEPQDPVLKYLYDRAQQQFILVHPIVQVFSVEDKKDETVKTVERAGFAVPQLTNCAEKLRFEITIVKNSISRKDGQTQYDLKIPKQLVTGLIRRTANPMTIQLVFYNTTPISINYESDTHLFKFFYCSEETFTALQSYPTQARLHHLIWIQSEFHEFWTILLRLREREPVREES